MKKKRRKLDLVVLSDIHLGTYGCQAKELNAYLKSIQPRTLILNGDIVDIWQFSKRYWPSDHMKVVKQILNLASKGTIVYYLTGNHDETLRKFDGVSIGNFHIKNKLELKLDGKKAWFFHGDVFDVIMKYSKWLAKVGAVSYDALILLNALINRTSKFFGKGKISLSKRVKDNVKSALKFINNFEETAAQVAMRNGCDYIICGHIHHPQNRIVKGEEGNTIRYLNSGDWVENLSALEYNEQQWSVYYYNNDITMGNGTVEQEEEEGLNLTELNTKELFQKMLTEFQN